VFNNDGIAYYNLIIADMLMDLGSLAGMSPNARIKIDNNITDLSKNDTTFSLSGSVNQFNYSDPGLLTQKIAIYYNKISKYLRKYSAQVVRHKIFTDALFVLIEFEYRINGINPSSRKNSVTDRYFSMIPTKSDVNNSIFNTFDIRSEKYLDIYIKTGFNKLYFPDFVREASIKKKRLRLT
jgi:hypothetical protein